MTKFHIVSFRVFLLVKSSSIEPKCFGSGYKPEPAQKPLNPKHEIRNSKQFKITNSNVPNLVSNFFHLVLEFVSDKVREILSEKDRKFNGI